MVLQDDAASLQASFLEASKGLGDDPAPTVATQTDDPGADAARLKERFLRRGEGVGFGEAATTRSSGKKKQGWDWVPYIATGREGIEWVNLFDAAERFNSGSGSAEDRELLEDFVDWHARSKGFGAGVGSIVGDAPVFMGEFATGAGIAGAIGKKALKTAGGQALLSATKRLAQTNMAGQLQKRATTRTLGKLAQAGAQGTAIAAVNELPRAPWGRVMANARSLQFQRRFGLSQDEAGDLVVEITDRPSDLMDVLPQAIVNEAIEYGSEMAGGAIPIASKLDALHDDVLSYFFGKVGLAEGRKTLQKFGFHGVWNEIGEEYLGAAVREGVAAAGGEEFEEFEGQLPETFGQTLEMYAGFGIIGGARRPVGVLSEKMIQARKREKLVERYRQDSEAAAAAGLDAPSEEDIQARVDREIQSLRDDGVVFGPEVAGAHEPAEALTESDLEMLESITIEEVEAALASESPQEQEPEEETEKTPPVTEQASPDPVRPEGDPGGASPEEGAPVFDATRIARAEGQTVDQYREVQPETQEELAAVRLARRLRPDLTVRFVEGMKQGGAYVAPGEILIKKGGQAPARVVAAHEAVHDFVAASGGNQRGNWLETHQELLKADPQGMRHARLAHRAAWIASQELEDGDEARAAYREAHPKGIRNAETLATYAGEVAAYLEMLGSEAGERHLRRLARRDPGMFQRVMDWIRSAWERLTGRSDFDQVAAQHGVAFPEGPRRESAVGAIMLREAMEGVEHAAGAAAEVEAREQVEVAEEMAEAHTPVGVQDSTVYQELREAGRPATVVQHVQAFGGIDLRGLPESSMRSEAGDAWSMLRSKEYGKRGFPAGVIKGPDSKAKVLGLSPDDMAARLAEVGFEFEGGEADPNQLIEWLADELGGGAPRFPASVAADIESELGPRGGGGMELELPEDPGLTDEEGDYVPFAPDNAPTLGDRAQFLSEEAWEAAKLKPLGKWDGFRRKVQDNALAVQRLQETIDKAGGNTEADPRTTIANMPGRVQARSKEIKDARDFILRRMRREDHWGLGVEGAVDMLGDVLYAQFAPEVNEYLREEKGMEDGSGMSDSEAAAILEEHLDKPGVADIVERFRRDIIEGTRDQMASGGVASEATVKHWREAFPNYVPLRSAEADAEGATFVGPRGGGMQVTGPIYHQREGRKTKADNPFVFGFAQAQSMNLASEKARVGRDLWEMMRHQDNVGLVSYTELEQPEDPGDWDPQNAFGVWIDGERKVLRLESDDVNRAMKNLGYSPVPGWMRLHRTLISTIGKLVTSWNPEFMTRNWFRDLETAAINITAEKQKGVRRRAVKNIFPAMRAIAADEFKGTAAPTEMGRFYKEVFVPEGGLIGWTKDVTFEEMAEDVLRGLNAGPVRRTLSGLVGFIEAANSVVEMSTRVAFAKALVDAGVPAKNAVRAARELTVDFNRRGEITSHLAAYKMFINARVQGAAQMVINAKRNPRIAALHASIFAFGFGTAMLNILAMGEDDDGEPRFLKKAEWERDRNIMIPNPWSENPNDMFTMPLTYGYNVFYVMGEAAAEAAYRINELGEDRGEVLESAATRSAKVLWDGFSPISDGTWLQAFSPTGATPVVQILENTNWNGQPVMPSGNPFDIAPPPDSERYWHSASPLSKKVAKTLNSWFGGNSQRAGEWMGLDMSVSPETLEHVYESYLGGIAKLGERGYKLATLPWEDTGVGTVPVVRSFYSDDKSMWSDRETYYAHREEVERVARELKAGEKLPAKAKAMARLNTLRKASDKRLKALTEKERATEDREERRRIQDQKAAIYRRFNGEVNSIRRGGKRQSQRASQ